jgi:hypothetical protein
MALSIIQPLPNQLTSSFWEGARNGELLIQQCQDCGHYNHPPQVVCGWCASANLEPKPVMGTGSILSWTTAMVRPGSGGGTPSHVNIVVELDVQPGILVVGKVPFPPPSWAVIGAPVKVRFEPLGDTGYVLPQFVQAGPGEA